MQGRDDAAALHRELRRATTDTSSTTWSRRSCTASPAASGTFLLQTSILRPAQRPAVRCRHRPRRRQGHARGPGSSQPVPGPAGRPPPLVSLPPACSRTCCRAHLADEQPERDPGPAGPGERAGSSSNGERARGRPARPGRRGLRASGGPDRAGRRRRCGATARRRSSSPGCRPCPDDDASPARPVLSVRLRRGPARRSAELEGAEARLRDAERWLGPRPTDGQARPAGELRPDRRRR